MSSARPIPETWELTGDDAKETLKRVGRKRLLADALKRLRFSDGFSHSRSMAFLGILLFVEGVIAAVGISRAMGNGRFARGIAHSLRSAVPGPAGRVLNVATGQAHKAASSGHWLPIAFGTIAALITGTTLMGQIERALNRLYGIETDRPTLKKYGRALLLALSAGSLTALALGGLGVGGVFATMFHSSGLTTLWAIVRWPLGIALMVAATALIFRWAPRRHQPSWSWMSFGAMVAVGLLVLVTVVLNVFFRFSSTFGSTYGPLAGIIALAIWAYGTSIALLVGAALAAQLEAVRAGATMPREVPAVALAEARIVAVGEDSPGEREAA